MEFLLPAPGGVCTVELYKEKKIINFFSGKYSELICDSLHSAKKKKRKIPDRQSTDISLNLKKVTMFYV